MPLNESTKTSKTSQVGLFSTYADKFYRKDIQGLRAISALMIMFYHIWFNKVSGGVDVFFVISGFLVTASLLRGVAVSGNVDPIKFITKIWRRVFPSAYVVLTATLLLSLFFVPTPLWKFGLNEFVASAAHIENLELMRMGTNYLDREAPPSQFQQFWALSIQMQFYLILPAMMWFLVNIAKRLKTIWPLFLGVSLIALLSFSFSIVYTSASHEEAYFHPATRFWEFLAGVLIALAYPFLHHLTSVAASKIWSLLAGAALIGLLLIGFLVDSDTNYPGVVALAPVSCAAVLLLAGKVTAGGSLTNRLLSNRYLSYLGSFSFTIYLWHWPLLVFAQYYFDSTELNFGSGMLVISVSVLLAAATKNFVEDPMMKLPHRKTWLLFIQQAGFVLAVVTVGLLMRQGLIQMAEKELPITDDTQRIEAAQIQEGADLPLSYLLSVDYDRPDGISCLNERCAGGALNSDHKILLMGDSHSAQWFDVLDQFGQREGFKVETRLSEDDISGAIEETQADVVVTVSTRTTGSSQANDESVRDLIHALIREAPTDIQIVGIRDNPRFNNYQNACVSDNLGNVSSCSLDRSTVYADINPVREITNRTANFHSVDLSALFCAEGLCPAVMDDMLVYYDKHHFSESFLIGISDSVMNELSLQAPEVFRKDIG